MEKVGMSISPTCIGLLAEDKEHEEWHRIGIIYFASKMED